MNKKKNWIRGFDRIMILLSIPIAIFGFFYTVKKYSEKKAVFVYLTNEEKTSWKEKYKSALTRKVNVFDNVFMENPFGYPDKNGVVASGEKALTKISKSNQILKNGLDRAYKKGGDPKGTLKNLGNLLHLIPRKSKLYTVGVCGTLGFAFITILSVGLTTRLVPRLVPRTFRWIKKGFNEK